VLIWLGVYTLPSTLANRDLDALSIEFLNTDSSDNFRVLWKEIEPWLNDLIHEEYWKRLWIIQEICLAVKLTIHFGTGSIQ